MIELSSPFLEGLFNSLSYLFWIAVILLVTLTLMKLVRKFFDKKLIAATKNLKVEKTQYVFLKHTSTAVIALIGFSVAIYIIPGLRTLAVSMLAGAGILAIVIGFASQEALSNIVGGVMIVIFKPYRVGDWVDIGTAISGIVEDINLRHTTVRNRENKRVVVPNSVMSKEVIQNSHMEDEKVCRLVEIGISYDSDIGKAMRIMEREAKKHPKFIDNRTAEQKKEKVPAVRTAVLGFGESSVNLRAWVWAENPAKGYKMHLDLNKSIKEAFDKEGIEIPFPYRTLVYKKDIKKPRKSSVKKTNNTTTKKAFKTKKSVKKSSAPKKKSAKPKKRAKR